MGYSLRSEKQNGQGFFLLDKDGTRAAKVRYRTEGSNTVVVEHTEVMPDYRGTEAGRTVVEKIINYAKGENLDLKSECSYFSHQRDKM